MANSPLPRRDLWLLPLLCGLTLVLLSVTAEVGARIVYSEQPENSCKVTDPGGGGHYVPDCTTVEKTAEGPWVTEHYNVYGFRSSPDWVPFPPGTRRVALLGTSYADGFFVSYEQSAGAVLAASLTAACRQPVEVLMAPTAGFIGQVLEQRLQQVLAIKPQVALFLFVARDLLQITQSGNDLPQEVAPPRPTALLPRLREMLSSSRAMTVMQHFLVRTPNFYLPTYLRNGDTSDFLRARITPAWAQRLEAFDTELGRLDAMSKSAGTTLALVYVPLEAQAVLATGKYNLPDVDPFALGAALKHIAARRGIEFHDGTSDFGVLANPQDAYYAADGHASGTGQSIIGVDVARQFLRDLPTFANCDPTRLAATMDHR